MRDIFKGRGLGDVVRTIGSAVPLVVLLAGIIGAWNVMQHRIDSHETAIKEVRAEDKEMRKLEDERWEAFHTLRSDVSSIHSLIVEQRDLLMKLVSDHMDEKRLMDFQRGIDQPRVSGEAQVHSHKPSDPMP